VLASLVDRPERESAEISDSKAAKKETLADTRAETEQGIAEAQERGHSR
jgi:hypothetical protein